MLPLPPVTQHELSWELDLSDQEASCYTRVLNVTAAGLNWMYSGKRPCAVPAVVNKLHLCVFQRLVGKLMAIAENLKGCCDDLEVRGAFHTLVGLDRDSHYPDLVADVAW